MLRSVNEGFDTFLSRLVPLASEREAASKHRASVEASLKNPLEVMLFRETGSFNHGTGVRGHCDVDLLVSLKTKPASADTALQWVKDALSASFPYTTVKVRRPAVVVEFNSGAETWEVIPGFRKNTDKTFPLYHIPGAPKGGSTRHPQRTSAT
jgi:tRNA nucleotidyltransferase (CCA-adding enzyme)